MIPTDRVSIEEIPEEKQPVEALVQEAFQQRPELEQAVLTLRNDEITLKGARNALLPTLRRLRRTWRDRASPARSTRICNLQFYPDGIAQQAVDRLWHGASQCVQQLGPGQGHRLQHQHSYCATATRSRCRRGR